MSWPETTRRSEGGVLVIGGVPATDLARRFGTPLYVFDEATLRHRARRMRAIFVDAFESSKVVYAGKAYLSPALMHVLTEEGIGLDAVSGGEIFAGLGAGVDPADIIFHGNNKSKRELAEALQTGVGLIAVDNDLEITLLAEAAQELGRSARVVLRLNPGVDPHTHHKMRTGAADSKFGLPIWDGQADRAVERLTAIEPLHLVGYHAHVGSQIFDAELVGQTIDSVLNFAARTQKSHGITPEVIIPGGGFGVADDASGEDVSIERWAAVAATALRRGCERHGLASPTLIVEPGRAIIGPAGVALYEVGSRKEIAGFRTYVAVDGGMGDNIRPALYGARYSAALANRDGASAAIEHVRIVGKYCESGDVLIEDIALPSPKPGDLLAVPMAGAYCLAMASNYNLSPRPAAVLVADGDVQLIRRRETYEDLLRVEVFAEPSVGPTKSADCLSAENGSL